MVKGGVRPGTYQRYEPFIYDPIPTTDTIRRDRTIACAVGMGRDGTGRGEDGAVTMQRWRVTGRCGGEV